MCRWRKSSAAACPSFGRSCWRLLCWWSSPKSPPSCPQQSNNGAHMNPATLPESRFKRILFCTDFSESADAAFEFALDAAVRRPASTLYLLHVIHEPDAQFWKSYMAEVDNINAEAKKAIDE